MMLTKPTVLVSVYDFFTLNNEVDTCALHYCLEIDAAKRNKHFQNGHEYIWIKSFYFKNIFNCFSFKCGLYNVWKRFPV